MILELDDRKQFILNSISLKTGKKVRAGHWNELWRYGASVEDKKEEEKAGKTLGRIAEWIDRKL